MTTFHPLCMTAAELELWEDANILDAASGPCLDCPVAWRERMNAVGMCNRQPVRIGRPPGGKHGPEVRARWADRAREYRARKAAAA